MSAPDPVTALVGAAEMLRALARDLEAVGLGSADSRGELRAVQAELRRLAFRAIALAAIELRPPGSTLAAAAE